MNQKVFNEIQKLKRQSLPDVRLILFGSQARGDAREDSDWDLLLLLDKDKRDFNEDYDRYGYPLSAIGDKYGIYISVKIYTKKDWDAHPSLFKYNIEKEGIEII